MKKHYITPITKTVTLSNQPLMLEGSILSGDTTTQLGNGFRRSEWSNGWDED